MRQLVKMGMAGSLALAAACGSAWAQGKTLETVKARGSVICGTNPGLPGFGAPDDKGNYSGFDVDFCRAVAAAIFDDPKKVSFRPLSPKERLTAVQTGEVDLLARNTTWTMSRDVSLGVMFVGTTYVDGQGFMVRKTLGVKSAKELNGASVCVGTGSTTELNLADYFRANAMTYKAVVFENPDDVIAAYESGRCDAVTTDQSGLFAQRLRLKAPDDHIVLPEIISKEPLAPAVRQGDDAWFSLVKWVYFALINAEEMGVNQKNVDEMAKSTNPDVRRLLGVEGDFGKSIGLDNAWAVHIIKGVGNYGEIFERNIGEGSRLKIARGLNQLWSKGGIQYAPPIR